MPVYRPSLLVLVNGTPVRCTSVSTSHGIHVPIPQATFVFPGPRHAALVYDAKIEALVSVGPRSGPIFTGVIRSGEDAIVSDGRTTTVEAQHPAYIVGLKNRIDRAWTRSGGYTATAIIEQVLILAGFGGRGDPVAIVDRIVDRAGNDIMLGSNAEASPDGVVLKEDTPYLNLINEATEPWGYRAFGLPEGRFRIMKLVADPPITPVVTFTEGNVGFAYRKSWDADRISNWHIVEGATWRDANGVDRSIRSVTPTLSANAILPPEGAERSLRTRLIDTQHNADESRSIRELRYNRETPEETVGVALHGYPDLKPGIAVAAESPSVQATGTYWLTRLDHRFDEAGCYADAELWRPGGTALSAGAATCTTTTLAAGPYHLGDDTLSNYAKPVPDGTSVAIAFTPAATGSSLTVKARAHSTTFSGIFDAGTSPQGQNRVELWQGTSKIGEAPIPLVGSLTEDMSSVDYTNDANWSDIELVISGTLTGGTAAELRLIAGHYVLQDGSNWYDEYEIKAIDLQSCSTGEVIAPTAPADEPPPPPSAAPVCTYSAAGPYTADAANNTISIFPAMIWPAGYAYCRITGDAIGATGAERYGGSETDTNTTWPAQDMQQSLNGGGQPLKVPGTTQPATTQDGLRDSGTVLVGDGPYEIWWHMTGGAANNDINVGDVLIRTFTKEGFEPLDPITVSNLCVTFDNAGPGG